jgi:transposase
MAEERKPRRPRRSFTDEFKAGAVQRVLGGGKTIPQVARDLDLTESALRGWVEQARADAGKGKPGALTSSEHEELARLRKEVRELRMDREILKRLTAAPGPTRRRLLPPERRHRTARSRRRGPGTGQRAAAVRESARGRRRGLISYPDEVATVRLARELGREGLALRSISAQLARAGHARGGRSGRSPWRTCSSKRIQDGQEAHTRADDARALHPRPSSAVEGPPEAVDRRAGVVSA